MSRQGEKTMERRTPTVLVFDDDASVRKSVQMLLRSAGYTVQSFASGEELLSHDPFEGPCCLVLDVQMPGMSGLDVQHRLAMSGRNVPIIFITALADAQMRAQARQAGATAFLIKPFYAETLFDAVEAALSGAM